MTRKSQTQEAIERFQLMEKQRQIRAGIRPDEFQGPPVHMGPPVDRTNEVFGAPNVPATIEDSQGRPIPNMENIRADVKYGVDLQPDPNEPDTVTNSAGQQVANDTRLRTDVRYENPPILVAGKPKGMLAQGNIDISRRPSVENPDGSKSTVRSMGVNLGDGEVLIPTVHPDGYVMTDDQAVEHYRKTGQHLGKFKTPEDSTTYAQALHQEQESANRKPAKEVPFVGPTTDNTVEPPTDENGRPVTNLLPNVRYEPPAKQPSPQAEALEKAKQFLQRASRRKVS